MWESGWKQWKGNPGAGGNVFRGDFWSGFEPVDIEERWATSEMCEACRHMVG